MREALHARVTALIDRLARGERDDAARDELLREVLRWQRRHVDVYDRIVRALMPSDSDDPLAWPAIPTDVFRAARVAAHAPSEDTRVFSTSGTSTETRGKHHLRDLTLYDRSAQAAARHALFPDVERMTLIFMAPTSTERPDSSLSYMLDRFAGWFGAGESVYVLHDEQLDTALLDRTLCAAQRDGRKVALLGTSFAFVHAEEALRENAYALPPGSRIMQTGGFKGRSRSVEPGQMLQMLATRYGVAEPYIVQEYGMTELCSQLYETALRDAALETTSGPRRLWAPSWVRATVVDPETLATVPEGAEGLLRIDDPCNLDTACAIQTSDRARRVGDGIIVLGRSVGATPRGCSLALDAALGG